MVSNYISSSKSYCIRTAFPMYYVCISTNRIFLFIVRFFFFFLSIP